MDQPTTPDQAVNQADLDAFLGVQPPSPRARYIKWGAIAAAVLLVLWIVWRLFFAGGADVAYATRELRTGDLTVTISATGNIQPTNQVDVGSELSGLVTAVYVDNNDRVTKGQVLARLDTQRLQDAINQSQAALQSAEAGVTQAQATAQQSRASLARSEEVYRLSGGKVPSGTEMDTARGDYARAIAAVRTAQAQVAQARAQLSSDKTQYSKASILSPVTGVVLSRQIEPGQTVAASLNAPVLFKIAEDLAKMQLEAKVDEADVGQVSNGQHATFTVDAFPGRTFPAIVQRVDVGANGAGSSGSSTTSSSTSSSSASGAVVAYMAILTVDNRDLLLRQGMTATAEVVTTEKHDVLLVPNAALRFSPDGAGRKQSGGLASVFAPPRPRRGNTATREVEIGRGSQRTIYVLGDDGKPAPIRVTVGDTNGSVTEVSGDGLKVGLKVITGQLAAGQAQPAEDRQGGQGERRRDREQGQPADKAAPATPPAEHTAKPAEIINGATGPSVVDPADRAEDPARAARRARWATMTPEERAQRRAERAAGQADGQ